MGVALGRRDLGMPEELPDRLERQPRADDDQQILVWSLIAPAEPASDDQGADADQRALQGLREGHRVPAAKVFQAVSHR